MAGFDVTERPVFDLGPDTSRTIYPSGVASGLAVGTAKTDAAMAASGIAGAEAVGTPALSVTITLSGIASDLAVGTATTDAAIVVSGINANTEAFGALIMTQVGQSLAEPEGVASTAAVGQPTIAISINPVGVAGSSAVGTSLARISILPTGVASTGTAFGTPQANLSVLPDGIAPGGAFGDPLTIANIEVVPGPIDPSNDFGSPTVTRYGFVFRPPVNTYRWRLFKEYEGISLLKESGVWSEVAHPDLARTLTAEKYLAGGRDHVLSTSLKDELVGLGYTVTNAVVTTEEYL